MTQKKLHKPHIYINDTRNNCTDHTDIKDTKNRAQTTYISMTQKTLSQQYTYRLGK